MEDKILIECTGHADDVFNRALKVVETNNKRHATLLGILMLGWSITALTLGGLVGYIIVRYLS